MFTLGALPLSRLLEDGVATDADESAHTLGVKGRDAAHGPDAPVLSDQDRPAKTEDVHQVDQGLTERSLLGRAGPYRLEEPRWTKAPAMTR